MRVDVLVTGRPPNGATADVTTTVLQNITVLSANQQMQPDNRGQAINATVVNVLVTPEQAQASLSVLYKQIREFEAQQLPASVSTFDRELFLSGRIAALPGDQGLRYLQTELRTSLLLLFGATCAVWSVRTTAMIPG
jgi:hypothetical protein